jgi:Lactate racemase N-terminal domain
VKVPLLAGTRVVVVDAPDDAVILRPPRPGEGIVDVGAAVRDALRFPLAERPLAALATRGGRATIVVEPPELPIPSATHDPRQVAITATADELVRAGMPLERQTILVAGGLQRRTSSRELETLVEPEFARHFHGRVEVHDAERPDLVDLGAAGATPLRAHPALVETELVVVVSAAETVLHGGPAALVGASGPETLRAAEAESLLEPSSSGGWNVAVALERALARRVPVMGVSLALNHPRLGGSLHGYPYEPEALERVAGSPLRHLFSLFPGALRARILRSLRCDVTAAAAFAGPPSVAHTEALLRAIEARSAVLDRRLDAICIGIPRVTPHLPRERPNPLLAAALGLALALRLWRDTFPLTDGGTVILLHRFHRRFAHPTQQPYRSFFGAARFGREPEELAEAERNAAADRRAVEAYRNGRACHPLLPFADWSACASVLSRVGAVLVAGCRDAVAARQLGFVPVHSIGPALAMARGRSEAPPRIGFLLSPPYFPLRVHPPA